MAKILRKPLRMCLSCRERSEQNSLLRVQCLDGTLQVHKGVGRSFYLCENCLQDEKRTSKALMRQCRSKEKEKLMKKLKEIITDGRKS